MIKLDLFEPAMCCSTGVCGPSIDQNLLTITSLFKDLQGIDGISANRYNLSSHPDVFLKHPEVLNEIQTKSEKILPITLVNDKIVKVGNYPTLEEISKYTDIIFVQNNQSSCDGSSNCC